MPLRLGQPNPTRTQRLNCSFHAMLLAWFTLVLSYGVWIALQKGNASFAAAFAAGAFLAAMLGFFLCLIGWLLALPLILYIRNLSGLRLWTMLLAGSSIGPGTILLVTVFLTYANRSWSSFSRPAIDRPFLLWLALSLAVSTFTTLLYLVLLGHTASNPKS